MFDKKYKSSSNLQKQINNCHFYNNFFIRTLLYHLNLQNCVQSCISWIAIFLLITAFTSTLQTSLYKLAISLKITSYYKAYLITFAAIALFFKTRKTGCDHLEI